MAISHGESPRLRRESAGATGGAAGGTIPVSTAVAGAASAGCATTGGTGPTAAGSRSAAANAAASAYRSAGSLARLRRVTAARSAGMLSGSGGTGSRTWASAVATALSATKGRRPTRHSKSTTPRE